MALNSAAAANALLSILQGLSGMGHAQIGVPKEWDYRINAWVSMGSQPLIRKSQGSTARDGRYMVMFAYRVEGAEATAEAGLMALVDAFAAAVAADLTLGGVCSGVELDSSGADEPEYQLRAGQEFRNYPVVVTARQYGTYTVNP